MSLTNSLMTGAMAASAFEHSTRAMRTIPGIILLAMLLLMISGMFIGFSYSRAAGFFTMAIFGAALLTLVGYVFGWASTERQPPFQYANQASQTLRGQPVEAPQVDERSANIATRFATRQDHTKRDWNG